MAISDAHNLNYISHGIPAKIFWSIYCNPMNGYGVAKNVYGVEKNPRTSKIYPNLELLEQSGLIKQDADKKYHVVIKCLMPHIEHAFKKQNISLNSDMEGIRLILQSDLCRKDTETMLQRIDLPNTSYKTDLFDDVTSYLSLIFSTVRFSQKEEESFFSNTLKALNRKRSESNLKPITHDELIEYYVNTFDKFLKTPHFPTKIIQNIRNETHEFLESCNYSIQDESKNLTDEKILAHLLFDLLIKYLPYSLQDKMSKLNPEISIQIKSSYLAMKYMLRENSP